MPKVGAGRMVIGVKVGAVDMICIVSDTVKQENEDCRSYVDSGLRNRQLEKQANRGDDSDFLLFFMDSKSLKSSVYESSQFKAQPAVPYLVDMLE